MCSNVGSGWWFISSAPPRQFTSSHVYITPTQNLNPSFQKHSHSSKTLDILALLCFVGQYSSSCKVLQIYYRVSAKYTMTSLSPKDYLKKGHTCIIIAKVCVRKRKWSTRREKQKWCFSALDASKPCKYWIFLKIWYWLKYLLLIWKLAISNFSQWCKKQN